MRLYIAGKMTGEPMFGFPRFMAAEAALEAMGHTSFNPARKDLEDGFNPELDSPKPLRDYMIDDVPALLKCDGLCVLEGWEQSRGAVFEVFVALYFGMPVFKFPSMQHIVPFVPFVAFDTCVDVMREGAKKHTPDTWLTEPASNHSHKCARHALTHIMQELGEAKPDGEVHARMACCRGAMLVAQYNYNQMQDDAICGV